MPIRVLIVAASPAEAMSLGRVNGIRKAGKGFAFDDFSLELLVTGIGAVPTAWSMMNYFAENGKPDLALNIGIAGTFNEKIITGDVVMPVTDCFADYGIEDRDGFSTLFDAGLTDPGGMPFRDGLIHSDNEISGSLAGILPSVRAVTTGTSTGSIERRDMLISKFNPDIETMEGASFFYICAREKTHFAAVRAVSNRIEARNRKAWNIPLALENLSLKLEEVFKILSHK